MLVLAGLVKRRVTLCCATRTNFAYYDEVLRYQPISVPTRSSDTLVYKSPERTQTRFNCIQLFLIVQSFE